MPTAIIHKCCLFLTPDPSPAVSHVMVLPLDPRAAAAVACTTPSAADAQNVDVMELFGGDSSLTDRKNILK